ncbi:FG-GAP repeat protein [Aureimonas sp. OT7]|uniref:FG-GAP repeat protein n=1 Tax=Aureimonas sp. OT7 TaxID=2816454 RepID=UPI001781BF92|nr:FG-GAP repeat protein [Aureimonas sp. OT7]QOG05523.1 FG-GAP repeat protein [Aureimonas sp. OT7]
MAQAAPTYILSDGVSQRVIQPGQRATVQAVAGRRYKLVRMDAAGAKPVADVIAVAEGGTDDGHLHLMTGDHTEIVIRDFFKAPDTRIDIPRPEGDTLTLDKSTSPLSRGADGSDLIGMAGTRSGLGPLAQEFAGHFDVLSADRFATALAWSGALESAAPAAASTLGGILGSAVGSAGTAAAFGSSGLSVGAGALAGVGAVIAGVAGASGSSSSSNTSTDSNTNTTTTTDPLAPLISIEPISDDYRINATDYEAIVGDNDTAGAGLTVSGTTARVENGNILTVKWAGLEKQVAVVDGKWSVTFSPEEIPTTDGDYSISVHVKNAAGKEKTETHGLPIDRTASIEIDPVTGDGVISASELNGGITLTGSTDFEDGRSISITVGDTKKTVTAAGGRWSAAFSKSELPTQSGGLVLLEGKDTAGNQAMMFANLSYDLTASISIGTIGGNDLLNATEIDSGTIVVSGTSSSIEDGGKVMVTWGEVSREATITSNTWSVSFTAADVPADGVSSISAAATDKAGNPASASHNLTIDRVAPTIAINAIATDDRVNAAEAAATVAITGTTNAANGATVTVIWNDVSQQGTVTNGAWTVAFPTGQVPGNSSYPITATVNDAAGNQGSATRTIVVAKDQMLQTISATAGYRIDGESGGDDFAYSISHLGDVNGDGLSDLIVGAPATSGGVGAAYILFGSTSGGFGQTFFDQVGGNGADSMDDDGTAKSLAGGGGDDVIRLSAASVAYGGAGNDTFEIANQAVITALASSFGNAGNTTQLAHIDGGGGIDTLKLTGSGLNLDLGSITNRSGGTAVNGLDRLSSIEIVDITGSGDNTLTLSLQDVLDLAGSNIFNDSNGADFGASASRHQMIVKSDAGDHVILSDQADWFSAGTVTWGGTTYTAYMGLNAYAAIYLEQPIV